MTTVNITTSTDTININNNTDQTINPNMYIPTKACNRCRTIKQLIEFRKSNSCHDGYRNQCKSCEAEYNKKYYDNKIKDELNRQEKEDYDINKNKTCNKCNQIKCITEFYKDKSQKDGYHAQCKTCNDNHQIEYNIQNTNQTITPIIELLNNNKPNVYIPTMVCNTCRTIKYITEFYKNKTKYNGYNSQCKTCESQYRKTFYNKDKQKEYRELNKHRIAERKKEYNQLNRHKIKEYKRIYENNKIHANSTLWLIKNNRTRIRDALKSNNKADHSINLLGCTKEFFYNFIKFQLPYEMDNNEFKENYHIDHVVPLASFDLSIPENLFIAFSWQNCAPLLKHKNLSKGAKRDLWSEVMQDLKVTVFLKLYYPEFCLSNVEES